MQVLIAVTKLEREALVAFVTFALGILTATDKREGKLLQRAGQLLLRESGRRDGQVELPRSVAVTLHWAYAELVSARRVDDSDPSNDILCRAMDQLVLALRLWENSSFADRFFPKEG